MDEEYEFYNLDNDSTTNILFDTINNFIKAITRIHGNENPRLKGASITESYAYKEPGAVGKIISEFKSVDAFHDSDGILESDGISKFDDILKKHAHEFEQIVDV